MSARNYIPLHRIIVKKAQKMRNEMRMSAKLLRITAPPLALGFWIHALVIWISYESFAIMEDCNGNSFSVKNMIAMIDIKVVYSISLHTSNMCRFYSRILRRRYDATFSIKISSRYINITSTQNTQFWSYFKTLNLNNCIFNRDNIDVFF